MDTACNILKCLSHDSRRKKTRTNLHTAKCICFAHLLHLYGYKCELYFLQKLKPDVEMYFMDPADLLKKQLKPYFQVLLVKSSLTDFIDHLNQICGNSAIIGSRISEIAQKTPCSLLPKGKTL